ncbi:MAG: glycoside hydrolase family 20 zincin-like fold domain-containing protein [Candidatus Glassbacteria bacterium]
MMRNAVIVLLFSAFLSRECSGQPQSALWSVGINLIPSPQEVRIGGDDFLFAGPVTIVLDEDATSADRFAADELSIRLKEEFGIEAGTGNRASAKAIVLTRKSAAPGLGEQGYEVEVDKDAITIRAVGEPGLFYGTRILLQIIQPGRTGYLVKAMEIKDWPDIPIRAVHYDTKHHQDKMEYLESFIRDLADYKINMLIWEWEDKFAYRSHPEIGAPGAFTAEQIRNLTRYARDHHVQLVPLIQGLGHVSYILKWPQNAHLREVAASNWEFCPLKEGSFRLLFDLWGEAIEATPGSEYLHIGSDETFELGKGTECKCAERMKELGNYSFYMDFINRSADFVVSKGRKYIAWTPPYDPRQKVKPNRGGPLMAEWMDLETAKIGLRDGYTHWVYTPNPGIEHLFLPYFYRENQRQPGTTLEEAYMTLSTASESGLFEGMICASWDDSGLHNQAWMMRFVNAAEYAWSGKGPNLAEFVDKYFSNYYGPNARDMLELFTILNKGAYYFMDSFERKVWHWGEIGKTHLPDLPRGDAIEYDPFWNTEYAAMVGRSRAEMRQMQRAELICRTNLKLGVKHSYDLELFLSIARLINHNAHTYLALSELENSIREANRQNFISHQTAYAGLEKAAAIIEESLKDRENAFGYLVATWEKTRMPKGMSTPGKTYLFQQDRARHFANRRPDMTYLICNEQMLDLEKYLESLHQYMSWYRETYLEKN